MLDHRRSQRVWLPMVGQSVLGASLSVACRSGGAAEERIHEIPFDLLVCRCRLPLLANFVSSEEDGSFSGGRECQLTSQSPSLSTAGFWCGAITPSRPLVDIKGSSIDPAKGDRPFGSGGKGGSNPVRRCQRKTASNALNACRAPIRALRGPKEVPKGVGMLRCRDFGPPLWLVFPGSQKGNHTFWGDQYLSQSVGATIGWHGLR